MKAISIRQPWAWLIMHGGKDIENRTWSTNVRGRVLVHAAKGMSNSEWVDAANHAGHLGIMIPQKEELQRGGIIGSVDIVDCVTESDSPWFFGPRGFVLRDPRPCDFRSLAGALGFFNVHITDLEL